MNSLDIRSIFSGLLIASVGLLSPVGAATIISYDAGPQDSSHDLTHLIDPECCASGFALHDHGYVAEYIPDPLRAYVIFRFDEAVVVHGLTIVQHGNGITKVEQFVGESDIGLTSTGSAWSSFGDVTFPTLFSETAPDAFTFGSSTAGTVHQFIIEKTSNPAGWASYRWYLDYEAAPVPELATQALMLAGFAAVAAITTRRRRM